MTWMRVSWQDLKVKSNLQNPDSNYCTRFLPLQTDCITTQKKYCFNRIIYWYLFKRIISVSKDIYTADYRAALYRSPY